MIHNYHLIEVNTINRFFSQIDKRKKIFFGFTSNSEYNFQKINSKDDKFSNTSKFIFFPNPSLNFFITFRLTV